MLKYLHPELDVTIAYLVAIVVFALVFLFNSYRLGRWKLDWYWNMNERDRRRFRRVVLVAVVGALLALLVPLVWGA